MKKKTILDLSPNELVIMEVFWKSEKPLSSVDLAEYITGWKSAYLNNLLSSLEKKGMIMMTGFSLFKKHYTRIFSATYSKEQYAAKIISTFYDDKKFIPKITAALIEELSSEEYEEISDELEDLLRCYDKEKGIIE